MKTSVLKICQSTYPAVQADASIRDAARIMEQHDAKWLAVTAEGSVIGLVSDWDIIGKSVIRGLDHDLTKVESIMRVGLPACSTRATLAEAAEIMKRKRIRQVAIVSEDERPALIGIVKAEDIIRVVAPERLEADFLLAMLG